jgi:hypothetical protein
MDDMRAQLPHARDILKRKQEALERSQVTSRSVV